MSSRTSMMFDEPSNTKTALRRLRRRSSGSALYAAYAAALSWLFDAPAVLISRSSAAFSSRSRILKREAAEPFGATPVVRSTNLTRKGTSTSSMHSLSTR